MNIITESALHNWVAHADNAPGIIVELVYRLVRTQCPSPECFRFPLDIGQTGVDGYLNVARAYPPYIPEGISFWEIGTGDNPREKATADFKKRSNDYSSDKKSLTTFVFVTPLSAVHTKWDIKKQEKWKDAKKDGGWKDIKILDATSLSDWLSRFPAIALWLYRVIHRSSNIDHIETPEQAWENISTIPSPAGRLLKPSLFLSNRDYLIHIVDSFLNNPESTKLEIQTRHPYHLPQFISALIQSKIENEKEYTCNNVILLEKASDLKNFADLTEPHVFVLREEGDSNKMPELCSRMRRNEHKIILPCSVGGKVDYFKPILQMPSTSQLQAELVKSGFTAIEAQALAAKSNGDLPCLLRILNKVYANEYWGQGNKQLLALISLIGEWDENNAADIEEVERLLGKTYEEWKKELVLLPKQAATPFRLRDDGICYFISRYEGWHLGGSIFTQNDLEKFFLMAEDVLMAVAHSSLNSFERTIAIANKETTCPSGELTNAVAEMLAIMASNAHYWEHGNKAWIDDKVDALVEKLLGNAKVNTWSNLGGVLPTLAEASPQVFLRQLSLAIASDDFLNALSKQEFDIFTTHPIVPILWALECLAWSQDWFPQVVETLGSLSQIILTKNSGNRPDKSLSGLFSAWNPNTCADINSQSCQLERLAKVYPLTAWKVILSTSPYSHGNTIIISPYMPRWRDFKQNSLCQVETIYQNEYLEKFKKITDSALTYLLSAKKIPLEELVKGITALPYKADEILAVFKICEKTDQQKEAWEILSSMFEWVGNRKDLGDNLSLLKEAITLLAPSDRYEQLKMYFKYAIPNYDDAKSYEEQSTSWLQKQQEIVDEIFKNDGLNGVLRFASIVEKPHFVGHAMARIGTKDIDTALIVATEIPDKVIPFAYQEFSQTYIAVRYSQEGDEWLKTFWNKVSPAKKLEILLCLPFCKSAWDLVKSLPEDFNQTYWKKVNLLPYSRESNIEYPLQSLMMAKRNGEVLRWLYYTQLKNSTLDIDIFKYLLLHPDKQMYRDSHLVVEVVEYLRNRLQSCDDDLVTIELLWGTAFHHSRMNNLIPEDLNLTRESGPRPECLNQKLLTDPEFFLKALKTVYEPRHQKKESIQQSDTDKYFAKMYYYALDDLIPPKNFSFSTTFIVWLEEVLSLAKDADRYEMACVTIGKVLFHADEDPNGLWIDKDVATILNKSEYNGIRRGFQTESINSRGFIECTAGISEHKIAQTYQDKALKLRQEGFHIFAECVSKIAADYENQAHRAQDMNLGNF